LKVRGNDGVVNHWQASGFLLFAKEEVRRSYERIKKVTRLRELTPSFPLSKRGRSNTLVS